MTLFYILSTLVSCTANTNNDEPGIQNILPLGDSITEGVPFTYRYPLFNLLSEENYPFDFVGTQTEGGWDYPEEGWDRDHEGHGGWMTQSIQEELPNWLPQYNVDIALVHLGTNDAGADDVEGSYAAMTSIVEQLRAHNDSVAICIAQILPFGSQLPAEGVEAGAEALNSFVVNWNSRIDNLASELTTATSPIVSVDMHSDFGDPDLDDDVHPNQSGARKMAEKWFACISSL